ncbi:MAG: Fur family transcriptional regulator [Bacillota bacterium]
MERRIREAKERVNRSRYKLTRQRSKIIETLVEKAGEHLSAEELYALVSKKAPEIGLATVYRTLDLLEHLDIVEKTNFGDGRARYELAGPDADHRHHHLICIGCGNITEVKEDLLYPMERMLERAYQFRITDHRLEFYGRCQSCLAENPLD